MNGGVITIRFIVASIFAFGFICGFILGLTLASFGVI